MLRYSTIVNFPGETTKETVELLKFLEEVDNELKLLKIPRQRYPKRCLGNVFRLEPYSYVYDKHQDYGITLKKEEVDALLADMGYNLPEDYLEKNLRFYLARTSHGSTLSRVVHAQLANMVGDESLSWELYYDALESDYNDIQGGTTGEAPLHCGRLGIHGRLQVHLGIHVTPVGRRHPVDGREEAEVRHGAAVPQRPAGIHPCIGADPHAYLDAGLYMRFDEAVAERLGQGCDNRITTFVNRRCLRSGVHVLGCLR